MMLADLPGLVLCMQLLLASGRVDPWCKNANNHTPVQRLTIMQYQNSLPLSLACLRLSYKQLLKFSSLAIQVLVRVPW